MKSTISSIGIVAITILTLAATAPLARPDAITNWQTLENKQLQNIQNMPYQISAVDLVNLAYRGALRNHGIPSYVALNLSYRRRTITAKDVVEAAVKANLIEAAAVNDRGYLNVVDAQLKSLESIGR